MKCPRCRNVELVQVIPRGSSVVLDACRQCKGIWFDARELDRILDVAAKELVPPGEGQQPPTALCPKCYSPMVAFHYPQTLATVDMCRECRGIWLDGGEFGEIRAVRRKLREQERLEEYAPVPGIKGAMLRFIDAAMAKLNPIE
jgi:uncharacterized protein